MKAKVRFRVQADKMKAVMLVGRPDDDYKVTMEELENAMKEEGICFGICTERLSSAVENQAFLSEIICAEGVPQSPGVDGVLKFAVQTKFELRPRIRDDGTADYHDMGLINEVDEGRLLCKRTRPVPGKDGMDIYGTVIPYAAGRYPDFPAGEGTKISSIDDTKLIAAHNGYIKFEKGIISVPDVFILNEDVNNGTGDIKFRGDVVINGCVREGFKVTSGGNVTVRGSVSGAAIFSDGDVTITDGFTGMDDGRIFAKGSVKSKYLQNVIVKCGGDLTTEYLLNSFATVGGEIHVEAGRGTIAGGEAHSCGSIFAKDLGAETYIDTRVIVDELPKEFWNLQNSTPTPMPATTDINEVEDFENEEFEMDDDFLEEEEKIPAAKDARIQVRNHVFPQVRVQIGMSFFTVEDKQTAVKFSVENGEIILAPTF